MSTEPENPPAPPAENPPLVPPENPPPVPGDSVPPANTELMSDEPGDELPPDNNPGEQGTENTRRGRGRPRLSEEEKARRQIERDAEKKMGDLFGDSPPLGDNGETPVTGTAKPIPPKRSKKDFEPLAELVVQNIYVVSGMILDPVEAYPLAMTKDPATEKLVPIHPNGAQIHAQLKGAWAEYFRSKDVVEISPGWAIFASTASYFGFVATQKKSSEKIKTLTGKIAKFIRVKILRKEA